MINVLKNINNYIINYIVNPYKNFSKKISNIQIKSYYLIFFVSLYYLLFLNISFFKFVFTNLKIENIEILFALISTPILLYLALVFFFSLLTWKYVDKFFLIFFLILSSMANYEMLAYGIYIDRDMIRNIHETNTREALDLITFSAIFWVFLMGIIPSFLISKIKIVYDKTAKELVKRIIMMFISLIIFCMFLLFSYKEMSSFGRNNKRIPMLINPVNYIAGTIRYIYKDLLVSKEFVLLDQNPIRNQDYGDGRPVVFIFVLGETARAENFSLNGYEKETNPLLSKVDWLINYSNVSSCGTATAVSVPCIFSNKPRKQFDNQVEGENLLDILTKTGFDIWWRENDDSCKGVCKRVKMEYSVDVYKDSKWCFGDYCQDDVLFEGLEEYIKNIKKDTFIVLHTMGSHGPTYYKRYPDKFKKFTPTCDTKNIQGCDKENIINTYDNTILYTDYIVASTIDLLKKYQDEFNVGMLYVSDHGESLGEFGVYLHGYPYSIAPSEQKQVPMFLWLSGSMIERNSTNGSCLIKNAKTKEYSHDNIFHTILGLFRIETTDYDKKLDIISECEVSI